MEHTLSRLILASVVALLISSPNGARADQIDGHWCYTDGRGLSIQGPQIVTPAGNKLSGDYDRHGFAYVVPEGEAGAGDQVLMLQQNHTTIHVWRTSPGTSERGPTEIWRRCDPRTS